MNILHVLGTAKLKQDPDRNPASGIVRAALELAKRQVKQGHAVTLVSVGRQAWNATWQGVNLVCLKRWRWAKVSVRGLRIDLSGHAPLVWFALLRCYDVIHAHNYGYLKCLRAGQCIMHFHSDPFFEDPAAAVHAWHQRDFGVMQQAASQIFVVNHMIKENLQSCVGTHLPIHVVGNGVDVSHYRQPDKRQVRRLREKWRIPEQGVVFLYAGVINRVKGVLNLAYAFQALANSDPGVHLAIAGTASLWARDTGFDYEKQVRKVLDPLMRSGRVTFLGLVGRNLMPEVYQLCDVVVVPSLWTEAFGMVILEAQASGRPVIASRVGGIPEIVSDTNGYLVSPGNVMELTDAMRTLRQDVELREYLGANGRMAAQTHNWEDVANRVDSLYRHAAVRHAYPYNATS